MPPRNLLNMKKRGKLKVPSSSIVIDLWPALRARNVTAPSALLQKIGISRKSTTKLLAGNAVQLNLQQLTALCIALNCTPNHLYACRNMTLAPEQALNELRTYTGEGKGKSLTQWIEGQRMDDVMGLVE